MSNRDPLDVIRHSPELGQYTGLDWLSPAQSGRDSQEHVRHYLFVAREKSSRARVLIKVTSKPGLVYEQNLANEISTLSTINEALPDSRNFPWIHEHGHLDDGRAFLVMSLFDEFPLATFVGPGSGRLVSHLRITIEVARALTAIHGLEIFHVDLNPMNILYTTERGRPLIRIIDFESSYERRRHEAGAFYSPPTTPGYKAPEIPDHPPDARSDIYSLGAVLDTLLVGTLWVSQEDLRPRIRADRSLDKPLRKALLTALDPDPAKRYPSAAAFQADLETYLEQIWPGRT